MKFFLRLFFFCYLAVLTLPFGAFAQDIALTQAGVIFPLTGGAAEFGVEMLETLQVLCARDKEIIFDLIVEDSKSNPREALSAYQARFSSEKIPIVFSDLSSVSLALAPLTSTRKQLLFAVAATSKLGNYKYTIRAYPEASVLAKSMRQALPSVGLKSGKGVTVLAIEDEFGQSVSEQLVKQLENAGAYTVLSDSFLSGTDFRSLALRYRFSDAFLVVGYSPGTGLLIRELRRISPDAPIIASPEFEYDSIKTAVSLPDPELYYVDIELGASFTEDFSEKLGRKPKSADVLIIKGFLALKEAVRELKKQGKPFSGDQIWQRIAGKTFVSQGIETSFSPSGDMNIELTLKSCKEGC